ncbi:MAG: type 4a pilus biogenesis protein PilO [Sedimentisphaerales bacterium]|nr:type 4a pilus biogenesis protein PilO [Sedimentisphaerales bacterium]
MSRTQVSIYVVCGLLVADFVLFGYLPARRQLDGLQKAISADTSAIQLSQSLRRQLPGLRLRLSQYQGRIEAYNKRIPIGLQMGQLVQELQGLMEGRLTGQQVVPSEPELLDGLYRTRIKVTCKGTLTDLFSFLRAISDLQRLILVQQLRLENDRSLSGNLEIEMELVVFHRAVG